MLNRLHPLRIRCRDVLKNMSNSTPEVHARAILPLSSTMPTVWFFARHALRLQY